MTPPQPGQLITLDGPGGAGKTTTAALLTDLLDRTGTSVHPTTQPSTERLGYIARRHSDLYRAHALACLVAADRYHQLDTDIGPRLRAGHTVICDRYVASTLVLQRMDEVPLDFLTALNSHATIPDLAVILTVDPATAASRIDRRGTRHRFETDLTAHQREAALYREAATTLTGLRWPLLVLDTTERSPAEIAELIAARLPNPPATAG